MLTSSEVLVLKALGLFFDDRVGCAYAGLPKLAYETGRTEQTVRRALRTLEWKGLVLRHGARRDADGSQTTNEYELPGVPGTAVGVSVSEDRRDARQQVFKASRSRVAVQLTLTRQAPESARSTAVGSGSDAQQVAASMVSQGGGGVDIFCAPPVLSSPPLSLLSSPPLSLLSPREDCFEDCLEEKTPPLPRPGVAIVEKGQRLPGKPSAKGPRSLEPGEGAGREQATAREVQPALAMGEGDASVGICSRAAPARSARVIAWPPGSPDRALYDETTRVLADCGIAPDGSSRRLRRTIHEALRMRVDQARCGVGEAGDLAVERWRRYREAAGLMRFTVGARRFFAEGDWLDPEAWPWDRAELARRRRL